MSNVINSCYVAPKHLPWEKKKAYSVIQKCLISGSELRIYKELHDLNLLILDKIEFLR